MQVTTFLMFEGAAEEAMNFYVSLFPRSRVVSIDRYGAEGPGKEGSVKRAAFDVNGTTLMCIDSPVAHAFSFTPAISLFVDCDDESEIDRLYEKLAQGGQPLMPIGSYGFSRKFGWIQDRYGVSWQINLP